MSERGGIQKQIDWVLKLVWDPKEKEWRNALEDEKNHGLSPGPHACAWDYNTKRAFPRPPQLPPLEHQYYVCLDAWSHNLPPPPEYVSDSGPGLQGLACSQVLVPRIGDLQSLRYLLVDTTWARGWLLAQDVARLTNLRQLIIYTDLKEVPDSWCVLNQVEVLHIRDILGLSKLLECLPMLKELRLKRGYVQDGLTVNIGRLTSLQSLTLSWWTELRALPSSVGSLSSLETLKMSSCTSLEALPSSLGGLSSLRTLDLSHCSFLGSLPSNIGSLSSLRTLDLSYCSSLEYLPSNIGILSSLQELNLHGCSFLEDLPESFGGLSCLRKLDLSHCSSLKTLPESLGSLSSLHPLDLNGCFSIQALPPTLEGLVSLEPLTPTGYVSQREISRNLDSLEALTRRGYDN